MKYLSLALLLSIPLAIRCQESNPLLCSTIALALDKDRATININKLIENPDKIGPQAQDLLRKKQAEKEALDKQMKQEEEELLKIDEEKSKRTTSLENLTITVAENKKKLEEQNNNITIKQNKVEELATQYAKIQEQLNKNKAELKETKGHIITLEAILQVTSSSEDTPSQEPIAHPQEQTSWNLMRYFFGKPTE